MVAENNFILLTLNLKFEEKDSRDYWSRTLSIPHDRKKAEEMVDTKVRKQEPCAKKSRQCQVR